MREEIGVERGSGWKKAIPEGRDRLQSRVLVWVVGSLLLLMGISTLANCYQSLASETEIAFYTGGISVAFAIVVLALRAATPAGALFGGTICLVLIYWTVFLPPSSYHSISHSGLAPLVLLFVLTFLSTRAGRRVKAKVGLTEGRRGRSAAQVIANLSVAALSVSGLGFSLVLKGQACCGHGYWRSWVYPAMMLMYLAALVEATADTVSSEIGQAFGGAPVMLLSLRRVEPGTDGAVTLLGSFAGIVAGAFVATVGMWALRLTLAEAGIALAAGVLGLFFDSLLGATVERKGWLGNDLVNFTSTLFAAGVALGLLRLAR